MDGRDDAEDEEQADEPRGSEGQSEGDFGELDDEALARRIFLDEQLAHQRRLMAIAGTATSLRASRLQLSPVKP